MILPPLFIHLELRTAEKKKLNLWLPFFLVWTIILILVIIVTPLLLVADLVLKTAGISLNLFCITYTCFGLLSVLKGTQICVNSRSTKTYMQISI